MSGHSTSALVTPPQRLSAAASRWIRPTPYTLPPQQVSASSASRWISPKSAALYRPHNRLCPQVCTGKAGLVMPWKMRAT